MTYADSSALLPLYVTEQFSEAAESVLRRAGQIPFTAIHQLELRTFIAASVARLPRARFDARQSIYGV